MLIFVADIVLHKQRVCSQLNISKWDVLSHEVTITGARGIVTKLIGDEDLHTQTSEESQLIEVNSHKHAHRHVLSWSRLPSLATVGDTKCSLPSVKYLKQSRDVGD